MGGGSVGRGSVFFKGCVRIRGDARKEMETKNTKLIILIDFRKCNESKQKSYIAIISIN